MSKFTQKFCVDTKNEMRYNKIIKKKGGAYVKKLTLQDIADAAGVSCATVSRCLSGREGVGNKTRERVLQLCREMGYNPNFVESTCSRSGRIGLMCPRLTESRCAWMAERLELYLAELGYALVIAQSYGSRLGEQEALHRLASQHVDGVIIIPTSRETRKALRAMEQVPEAVFLGAYLGDQPESYVAVDHFLGGQAAVRHLEKEGCQRLLFVGNEESEASNKRRSGVVSAAKQLHVSCVCVDAKELPQVDWDDYDGIIAADCGIARQIPAQKQIVSFDGDVQSDIGITTLDTPDNIARIAADILLEKLERPIGGYSHRMVVPELKQRKGEVKTHG